MRVTFVLGLATLLAETTCGCSPKHSSSRSFTSVSLSFLDMYANRNGPPIRTATSHICARFVMAMPRAATQVLLAKET